MHCPMSHTPQPCLSLTSATDKERCSGAYRLYSNIHSNSRYPSHPGPTSASHFLHGIPRYNLGCLHYLNSLFDHGGFFFFFFSIFLLVLFPPVSPPPFKRPPCSSSGRSSWPSNSSLVQARISRPNHSYRSVTYWLGPPAAIIPAWACCSALACSTTISSAFAITVWITPWWSADNWLVSEA